MNDEELTGLVAFLQDRVGDNLRSVLRYDSATDDYELVYCRPDVREQYEATTIERLVQTYQTEALGKVVEEDRYELGRLDCTVRCFEDGIELNLFDDGSGVVVGLEPDTFLAHNTFIGKCLEVAGIERS